MWDEGGDMGELELRSSASTEFFWGGTEGDDQIFWYQMAMMAV